MKLVPKFLVPGRQAGAKKRLVKSPKVYIRDTGIMHRLLNIPNYDALLGNPGVGGSWEGYVIEQIYQRRPPDVDLFFYRTQAGAECDLVLVKGITPLACIEIKLSNAPVISKGFFSCVEKSILVSYLPGSFWWRTLRIAIRLLLWRDRLPLVLWFVRRPH